jgi:hypothetical protein
MAGSSTALSWGVPNATAEAFSKVQACFEAEGFEFLPDTGGKVGPGNSPLALPQEAMRSPRRSTPVGPAFIAVT